MKNLLKRFASLAFAVVLTLGLAPVMSPSADAANATIEEGDYYIRPYNFLGASVGFEKANAYLTGWNCVVNYYRPTLVDNASACKISAKKVSNGKYKLMYGGSALTATNYFPCIRVRSYNSYSWVPQKNLGDGAIYLDTYRGSAGQLWSFEKVSGGYRIKSDLKTQSGTSYLRYYYGEMGNLTQNNANCGNQIVWELVKAETPKVNKTYYLQSAVGSMNKAYLDVYWRNDSTGKYRKNVQGHELNYGLNQQWKLEDAGKGYYYIKNVRSGKYLDVYQGSKANGANVWVCAGNKSAAQKWKLVDAGSGYYYIQSALSTYLDVAYANPANETNVWAHVGNKSNAQKWQFIIA